MSMRQFIQGPTVMVEGDPPAAHPVGFDPVGRGPCPYRGVITRRDVPEVNIDATDHVDLLQQLVHQYVTSRTLGTGEEQQTIAGLKRDSVFRLFR